LIGSAQRENLQRRQSGKGWQDAGQVVVAQISGQKKGWLFPWGKIRKKEKKKKSTSSSGQ